jgi:hypothetical protein
MAYRSSITLWMTAVALIVAAGPQYAAQRDVGPDALERFQQSANEYVALRRQVERRLPPREITRDARKIHEATEARAAAIRRARPNARVGDIFTADVGDAFRTRIRRALDARGYVAGDLLRQMDEEGEGWEPPIVNGRFSWRTAIATPACVLAVLPALPEELQYRFVGSALVLVDIDANLIVDVLPDVLGRASLEWT